MRYSTVPAINLDEHVNRNRQLIASLPPARPSALTWNPERRSYDLDETALDLFMELFNS